jgi:hypothetical protein
MSQNPYRPSTDTPSSSEIPPFISAAGLGSVVGSTLLVLLGITVAGLAMLPSDAPGFFLLNGGHLLACGLLGVTCAWVKQRGRTRRLFCWTSIVVNAAFVVRFAIVVLDGTVRGPVFLAACIPAALNVASAALNLRRGK